MIASAGDCSNTSGSQTVSARRSPTGRPNEMNILRRVRPSEILNSHHSTPARSWASTSPLLERDEFVLEAELEAARLRAGEIEKLHRKIIEVETRIAGAKQERDLEQALAEEEMARDILRDDREEGYRLAAGWMLADFIRHQTRDRDRPHVFHRARELFVRMTQGRYVLQFSDTPSPSFRAVDTTTNMNHGLDELSSATRVQLLMAVRMGFVEDMEHGPKLPLFLDETLGNADEHRAEAIIRSVCEICRNGRQIFYFTAQLDEVGKWRRLLREYDGLPYRVISLVETRQLPEYERSVLEDLQPSRPAVPRPAGLTHQHVSRPAPCARVSVSDSGA